MTESPLYKLTGPHNFNLNGYEMAQNMFAPPAWIMAIMLQKPELVIEIGTGFGGFSCLLKKACDTYGGHFISIEKNFSLVKYGEIPFYNWDCFEHTKEIKNWIDTNKQVFILCDGGDKIREFKTFAPMLKNGDVIAAHDYALNEPDVNIWSWVEIREKDIAETCDQNNLGDFYTDLFQYTAWVVKMKFPCPHNRTHSVDTNPPKITCFDCGEIIQ